MIRCILIICAFYAISHGATPWYLMNEAPLTSKDEVAVKGLSSFSDNSAHHPKNCIYNDIYELNKTLSSDSHKEVFLDDSLVREFSENPQKAMDLLHKSGIGVKGNRREFESTLDDLLNKSNLSVIITNNKYILVPDRLLNLYLIAGELIREEYFRSEIDSLCVPDIITMLNHMISSQRVNLTISANDVDNVNAIKVLISEIKNQPFLYVIRKLSLATGADYYIDESGKKLIFDFSTCKEIQNTQANQ